VCRLRKQGKEEVWARHLVAQACVEVVEQHFGIVVRCLAVVLREGGIEPRVCLSH
jgi:hypothetical protein